MVLRGAPHVYRLTALAGEDGSVAGLHQARQIPVDSCESDALPVLSQGCVNLLSTSEVVKFRECLCDGQALPGLSRGSMSRSGGHG